MLMSDVPASLFVDLYAGSGAVGLEALSRGAEHVVWVEKSTRHIRVLRSNAELIAPGRGEIICADIERWLKTGGLNRCADIVFADPPYADALKDGFGLVMGLLAENNVVAPDGVFVAEMPAKCDAEDIEGWVLNKDRLYGHTRLAIYRRV
jgi:16S rRNA (guanine(966)-N(2))-methyltransferase RsmD